MLYSSTFAPKLNNKEVDCTILWFSNDFAICTGSENALNDLNTNLGHIFDVHSHENIITLSIRDQKLLHNIKYLHKPLQTFGKNKNTKEVLSTIYKYATPDRKGIMKTHRLLKLADDLGDYKYATITHDKNSLVPEIKYNGGFSKFIPVSNINTSNIIKTKPQYLDAVTLRTVYLKVYASIYNSSKLTVTDHSIYKDYATWELDGMLKEERALLARSPNIWKTLDKFEINKYFFNSNALDLQAYIQNTSKSNIVKVYNSLGEGEVMRVLDTAVGLRWEGFINNSIVKDYEPDILFNFFKL